MATIITAGELAALIDGTLNRATALTPIEAV